jgi:hypothetical protein
VDGYAAGFLRSLTGTLIVGEAGEAECDMIVATVIIDGCVRGNVHATERVEFGMRGCLRRLNRRPSQLLPARFLKGGVPFSSVSFQSGFRLLSKRLPSPFKADSEDDGRTSSSNPTFSSPNLPGPNEEEAEPMAIAASR